MSKKFRFKSEKKKQKWRLFSKAINNEQKDMLKKAHTELFGNGEIIIDGCLKVLEYNDLYLKLKINGGTATICGSNFDIISFDEFTIDIKGRISSVEYCM